MTITYELAPEPKWILINNNGTVAGGGKLFTYSNLNPDILKPVYMDPEGAEAWTNPILFDLNGVQGPFYWEVDSANSDDTYFLIAKDAQDNLLWTLPNFSPPGSGGGGGGGKIYLPLTNYIANNQFIDHISDTALPSNVTSLVLAPSNHKGFTPYLINPVIGTYGALGPDIMFVKTNTAATDQISFVDFPLGSAPMSPTGVTPVRYIRYTCSNSPAGETYKSFQFPITQKVKNLSNQIMTFSIWAAVTATPANINIFSRQYYGSGTGATAESGATRTQAGSPLSLTTTWTQSIFTFTMPSVSGNSLGTPGLQTDDDAVYIQIDMPLGSPCDILFTLPSLYLGNVQPLLEFEDYDQINSVNSTPRTGDIKTSLSSSAPLGWVAMNDGSIGNSGSGATNRANADAFQLYKTIWDGVINTWAPTQDSAGTPTARGATAIADFLANKRLVLPLSLGRALAGAGAGAGLTARVLGQNVPVSPIVGNGETVVITGPNLPHGTPWNPTTTSGNNSETAAGGSNVPAAPNGFPYSAGSDVPISIMQPTSFFNVFIKL